MWSSAHEVGPTFAVRVAIYIPVFFNHGMAMLVTVVVRKTGSQFLQRCVVTFHTPMLLAVSSTVFLLDTSADASSAHVVFTYDGFNLLTANHVFERSWKRTPGTVLQ